MIRVFVLAAFLLFALVSCSHGGKSDARDDPKRVHAIRQLIPYTLKVRRPLSPGADPKAGPGGIDYQSNPLPDENFDCREIGWLFRDINLADARACLATVSPKPAPLTKGAVLEAKALKKANAEKEDQDPKDAPPQALTQLRFNVRWLPVPELELDTSGFEEVVAAECLKKSFGHVPVPREIFFQSNEGGSLACYSSRLAVESNEIGGFKLPMNKTALRVDLPLKELPKDDGEMRMLLMTWALTPFWDREKNTIASHYVPDVICRRCLGEKSMLGPTDPKPVLWPTGAL